VTQFLYFPLSGVEEAHGVVVVIDVLRAFTTAAYAFDRGAEKILPVSSIAEAFILKRNFQKVSLWVKKMGSSRRGLILGTRHWILANKI
jgi:2-phosphosulfolactate phosphatase